MKKEELIEALAIANKRADDLQAYDKTRREELSLMLAAPLKKRGAYEYSDERIIYTWAQIFFELGKLTAKRDHLSLLDRLTAIEHRVSELSPADKSHE